MYHVDDDAARAAVEHATVLAKRTARRLGEELVRNGPARQGGLVEVLGLSQSTVSKHLNRLVEAGLVVRRGGRPYVYQGTETLGRALQE